MGGSDDGLTTDEVSVDEELVAGVTVETSLTVLGDNWSDDTVVVFEVEIIEVDTSDTFNTVPVALVGFKTWPEVITPLAVDDVTGVSSDDELKSTDEDLTRTTEVRSKLSLLSGTEKLSETPLVERELLLRWIR